MFNIRLRRANLFDELFDEMSNKEHSLLKTDIKEMEDHYLFEIDLPGIKKEDIKISLENNYLAVQVLRNSESEEENDGYIRRERSYGSYKRKYYVGDIANEDLKASYEDGVLKIIVSKNVKESKVEYLAID